MKDMNCIKATGTLKSAIYTGSLPGKNVPFAIFYLLVNNGKKLQPTLMKGVAYNETALDLANQAHNGDLVYIEARMGTGYSHTKSHGDRFPLLQPIVSRFRIVIKSHGNVNPNQ